MIFCKIATIRKTRNCALYGNSTSKLEQAAVQGNSRLLDFCRRMWYNIVELSARRFAERGISMIVEYVTAANPAMGNVSVNTYLIIFIAAAVLVAGAVVAGIISKKKKK